MIQRDTYFLARHGRLKLREEEGAAAHLVAYERLDLAGRRESEYRIVTVESADETKAALSAALGVKAVVAKERRLLIWKSVRIHLDRVEGLGHFIEFEAVVGDGALDLHTAEGRVEDLRRAFHIADDNLIGGSYCDLAADRANV